MKISQKHVDMFNSRNPIFEPCYNESYNESKGLPSMKAWGFMCKVRADKFGIFGGKITLKMVKAHNPEAAKEHWGK